jgi:tRNA (mo5U34)-methyltransferase
MDIENILKLSVEYRIKLTQSKETLKESSFWYPYGIMDNVYILHKLLTGNNRGLLDKVKLSKIADIGGADGDLAFFLEALGFDVDIIDHAPTNFNHLKGAQLLKTALNSSVNIYDIDLDSKFSFPNKYDLIFFLGILYHLKNPYYVLENLSQNTKYCFISTRIAKMCPDKKISFGHIPVAYLLGPEECNNDSTNYWIFSDTGFKRILSRTGWEICDYIILGNTVNSDPVTPEGDERAICLVKSLFLN